MRIWYRVADLDAARAFYRDVLGFTETFVDEQERWASLDRGTTEIARRREPTSRRTRRGRSRPSTSTTSRPSASGSPSAGVEVGTVLELHGAMRLVDVFDPDGNRIQLAEDLS